MRLYLQNSRYRENIRRATEHALEQRRLAVDEIPDWERLRQEGHRRKQQIIDHLPEHLNQFIENARARGIVVYQAPDARTANQFVEQIARQHGVRRIVKSKSMVTEEIGLNAHLQQNGLEVVETDLGEYIVQLAGETPVHLVGPALHKSRQEIGQLFAEKLGVTYTEDPSELTRLARNILREKFLTADMGITGANFGIVDSGRVVVVENEGNARLCMTLPRIRVVIMGMERLIPSEADLPLFLTLLCRSATGQRLTSYVSITGGPASSPSPEGPEKVYYVVVDNGRSRLLQDPHLKKALYCIRCAACYNICPIYQTIGGHAYGWVYQGPIGAVITPELSGDQRADDLPFASTLCGACSDICPVKIPLHHLLLYQRQRIVQRTSGPHSEKLGFALFEKLARHSMLWNRMIRLLGKVQRVFPGELPVPGWTHSRIFPRVEWPTFTQWWQKHKRKTP
ncbi:MAG: iron-sulfur cluster-binding protein [Calditrichaeota bacterium]|nr:iron-sulfur cluster-binding protein [Calditrichota bacterium]